MNVGTKKRLWLTVFLISPAVIVAALLYVIAAMSSKPPLMDEPPVGAGAGQTGGANALGNVLAGHKADYSRQDEEAEKAAAAQPSLVQPESLEQGFILIVQDKASKATAQSPIYIAGTFNNWNPADPAYKLTPQSDMRWRIEMPRPAAGPIKFKFTRGSWALEELKADLSAPGDRTLAPIDASKLARGEKPRIELVVERWGDEKPDYRPEGGAETPASVTGDLRRLQVQGGAGGMAGQTRDLLVWLPPGYDDPRNAERRYPVLYLHDGQNLFSKPAAAPAEWGVDETATDLITNGAMQPVIIVGIPHAGEGRIREYLPVAALNNVKPEGDEHVAWLIHEVMPRVERAFRVKTGADSTGIGGSSLGAAVALHAATKYPDRFGIVLAESLPLRTGNAEAWDHWLAGIKHWPKRVYLGVGGRETGPEEAKAAANKAYEDATRALDKQLAAAGLRADRRLLVVDAQATHTETAWAKRLPEALRFLFPPTVDGTK